MPALSPELRAFLKPGLAGTIAAADAARTPYMTRVWAARYLEARGVIELYVLLATSERFLECVARGGRAAANLVEVTTYRSRAFKGMCTVSGAVDPAFRDECLKAMDAAFASVGIRPDGVARMLGHAPPPHEMVALLLDVDSVFDQSPKPGAGARL